MWMYKSIAIVCIALLTASGAQAGFTGTGDIWNIDFEADTVGLAPSVAAYSNAVTNTVPSNIRQALQEPVVVADSVGGFTTQVGRITGNSFNGTSTPPSGDWMSIQRIGLDTTSAEQFTTGQLHYEYDFSVISHSGDGYASTDINPDTGNSGTGQYFFAQRFYSATTDFRLLWVTHLYGTQGVKNHLIVSEGQASGGQQQSRPEWEFGVPMHIEVDFDLDTGEYNLSADGVAFAIGKFDTGGLSPMRLLDFRDAAGFVGSTTVAATYDVAIDNIVVTPEPATMTVLCLGGLAFLRRRRR